MAIIYEACLGFGSKPGKEYDLGPNRIVIGDKEFIITRSFGLIEGITFGAQGRCVLRDGKCGYFYCGSCFSNVTIKSLE